jgi:hypothetical protein
LHTAFAHCFDGGIIGTWSTYPANWFRGKLVPNNFDPGDLAATLWQSTPPRQLNSDGAETARQAAAGR